MLAIFNYSFWMRFQTRLTCPESLKSPYLAFCIIGMITYVFCGGPLFFFSYKYARDKKTQTTKLRIGIVAMYFMSSLPLWIMELWLMYNNMAVVSVLDGMVFSLSFVSWSIGTIVVWFIYMWEISRFLQSQTGAHRQVMFNPQLAPNGEVAPPYLTAVASRVLPGQPAFV